VPRRRFHVGQVAHDLFVVANREELVAAILFLPLRAAAGNELHRAVAEAMNLVSPLALERSGTNHEHALDIRLLREELRDADSLYGLAEPHVVRQDRAPRADREGDAVELIGKELGLKQ